MAGERESRRTNARLIFERVREDADEELARPGSALLASALFAGFTLGASPLALSLGLSLLTGADEKFVAALLYPIGYVAVILGRAQLFTENTLYPVIAALADRTLLRKTALLWAVVLAGNLIGAAVFALVLTKVPAFPDDSVSEFTHLGTIAAGHAFGATFWGAVAAGWLLALVAWVIEGSDDSIGQIALIWALTVPVALAALDHSVASALTVLAALFDGDVSFGSAIGWEGTAILGNAVGGVGIVALINWGQAIGSDEEDDEESR